MRWIGDAGLRSRRKRSTGSRGPAACPRQGGDRVALRQVLQHGQPEIFNTDQGAQFTATEFTHILEMANIRISMDGRVRALDNAFVERLWRTVKYEHLYLMDYDAVPDLEAGVHGYFHFYNHERLHQSLEGGTPAESFPHAHSPYDDGEAA